MTTEIKGTIILLLGLATACGSESELPTTHGAGIGADHADMGTPDSAASEDDAATNLGPAEDDHPLTGLDAKTILAQERRDFEGRPCGVIWPDHPEPIIRFGWDDQGRLQFYDYVIPDDDFPHELESRTARYYDEQGRLTDEVYVDGLDYVVRHQNWYKWEGTRLLGRGKTYLLPERDPYFETITIADDHWSMTGSPWPDQDSSWDYDANALVLIQHYRQNTITYRLTRAVTPEEVIVLEGIHPSFFLLGPVASSSATTGQAYDHIRNDDGNIEIGRTTVLFDCSAYL